MNELNEHEPNDIKWLAFSDDIEISICIYGYGVVRCDTVLHWLLTQLYFYATVTVFSGQN